ncbi:MAG: 50S ribosomal protein L4 [Candidatus Pacebacteria bacterium CG_4_10_14_0_8_um_filter_42_14]|nr:MAG: 50S ribosomal protein L4 [Candidatus Pacebacteria bacterium CG_4_10_14_0_8_um_filter_42_14]
MNIQKVTATGTKSNIVVDAAVFGVSANKQLLSQAVHIARSNQRQGTSRVKTRAQVSLTKKKVYKQKGTGNARHGAKSAPIFVGGGVAHGPTGLANWTRSLPPALKRASLAQALTLQIKDTYVVDALADLNGKTKQAAAIIAAVVPKAKRILVVLTKPTAEALRALKNLPRVTVIRASQLSVLPAAQASVILFTSDSLATVTDRIKNLSVTPKVVAEKPAVSTTKKQAVKKAPKVAPKKAAAKKAVAPKKPTTTKSKTTKKVAKKA